MQNSIYKAKLMELYIQIYNQNQNLNTNNINNSINLYNNVDKTLTDISNPFPNLKIISKLIESEDDTNLSTQRNSFNIDSLKIISNESFEVKSSYENINKLNYYKYI